ncbi:MAG: NAD(P)-dependent oxidoreductase, partial [Candidatus Brocadiia bacterium]
EGAVGLIGTGYIGHGLADCLLSAGVELHVHDVHPERADDLVQRGAVFEPSPRIVAEACDVVFMAVVSDDQVEQVLFGEDGAACGPCAGKVFVDTATIPPSRSREMAARLAERGADLLDAPLIGGRNEGPSETMPVGGSEEAFQRCRPLLETVAKNVVRVGPSGAGEVVKLMNQTMACAHMACRAEAIVYAEKWGVPLQLADRALGPHDRAVGWLAEAAKRQEAHGDPTHWTRLFLKDMNCALEAGLPMPVAPAVRDLNARALEVEPEGGWPYSFLAAARDIAERG